MTRILYIVERTDFCDWGTVHLFVREKFSILKMFFTLKGTFTIFPREEMLVPPTNKNKQTL